MEGLGELMVLGGLIWFVFGDNRMDAGRWPFMLALVVIGAALYFLDKAIDK